MTRTVVLELELRELLELGAGALQLDRGERMTRAQLTLQQAARLEMISEVAYAIREVLAFERSSSAITIGTLDAILARVQAAARAELEE